MSLLRDGDWKFVEDLVTKKEIGFDEERLKQAVGYHNKLRVLSNDGETIIFEHQEWERFPRKKKSAKTEEVEVDDLFEEDEDGGHYVMKTYRLKKFTSTTTRTTTSTGGTVLTA